MMVPCWNQTKAALFSVGGGWVQEDVGLDVCRACVCVCMCLCVRDINNDKAFMGSLRNSPCARRIPVPSAAITH